MQSRTLHLRVGRSVWAAVLLLATAVGAASPTHAQSITVTDAVSREVAVLVDPSIGQPKQQLVTDAVSREVAVLVGGTGGGTTTDLLVRDAVSREVAVLVDASTGQQKPQLVLDAVSREVAVLVDASTGQQKPQLVLDAVSREVAVLVDASTGQQKPQLVLDAVSRELAVRVEPTFGFDKGQLVRDSVSREFQIYVNPTDANGNGVADLLEPTAQTANVFASAVPATNSAWRDEGEAAGNPGCGEVCPCNSQFEPYAFNGGQGVPPDATYLVGGFGGFSLPANRVISAVVADVMCRYNDGTSGSVDLRVTIGGQQLLLANQAFTSTSGCEYRFGGAGRVIGAPAGGWTPDAIANLNVSVRRSGPNTSTLRVRAFRLTVTTVERDTDGDGLSDSIDNCPNQSNPLQQDCDSNGIGDACELILYPERDANMNGVIDACENVAGWVGGLAGAFDNPANWSSGRVPDASTAVFLRAPGGGTFTMTTSSPVTVKSFVLAAGMVRLNLGGTFRVNELFTVSSGATLVVDGVDGIRTLELAGFSQVRGGGRLEIAALGAVRALASGSFSGEPLSNLTFALRPALAIPLQADGPSAFRGGISVKLGVFVSDPLPVGTRFTLVTAANASTGFYSALSAQGLSDRFLKVVGGESFGSGQLVLEVSEFEQFVSSAGGSNESVAAGEEPTAIAARNFTAAFDAFDDLAVTVRRTAGNGTPLPGNLYVFRGDGAGGISEQAVYPTALEPIAVEGADLDGDGTFDVAVLCRVSGQLQVFLNPSETVGGFVLNDTEPVGVGATYLALSPLTTGASLNPLVVGQGFVVSVPAGLTLVPGKIGGGTIVPFPGVPVSTPPGPVSPIDDTSKPESAFMVSQQNAPDDEYGRLFILEVSANGGVTQGAQNLGPAQPLGIETGSLNDDVFTDMVVTGLSSTQNGSVPSVTVFPGTSVGFATGGSIALPTRPLGLALGDFTGSGKGDFAVALGTLTAGVETGEYVRRFNNVTTGASSPVFESGPDDVLFPGEGIRRVRRADLNAQPPDDFAVLGETAIAPGGSFFGDGGQTLGYGGGRVFAPVAGNPCFGDLNSDGEVNALDVANLLSAWGESGVADLNGSEVVDAFDLSILLGAWGACPSVN